MGLDLDRQEMIALMDLCNQAIAANGGPRPIHSVWNSSVGEEAMKKLAEAIHPIQEM